MELYLSPIGNDSASGDRDAPIQTIGELQKRLNDAGKTENEIQVYFGKGVYPIESCLHLDSLTAALRLIGEDRDQTVVTGGVQIRPTGTETVNGNTVWKFEIPRRGGRPWVFHQLFANGERRPFARMPQKGYFVMKDVPDIDTSISCWDQLKDGTKRFRYFEEDIPSSWELENSQIIVHHYWVDEKMPVQSVDPEQQMIVSEVRSVFALRNEENNGLAKYYIENIIAGLLNPGDWYFDYRNETVYYLPHKYETVENTAFTVPCVSQFVRAEGTEKDKAGRVEIENLTFTCADWYHTKPCSAKAGEYFNTQGFDTVSEPCASAPQAALHVPGVLAFRHADHCAVVNCVIRQIGFSGVEFGPGCRKGKVCGTVIEDMGGGGVRIGGTNDLCDPDNWTGEILVENNHIHHGGLVFTCAVGILSAHSFENVMRGNHIHDLFYTGISCGWVWDYGVNISRNNIVEGNHIHDIGKGVVSDMGGIYTLGVQPGTVLRGNNIHHVFGKNYGGWGIYLDQASSYILIEQNVVWQTGSQALHIHYGTQNIIRNNLLADSAEGLIQVSKADPDPHLAEQRDAALVYRNIFLSEIGAHHNFESILAPQDKGYSSFDNLYWSSTCDTEDRIARNTRSGKTEYLSLTDFKKVFGDAGSIYGDPQMESRDSVLTFAPGSPARTLGILPFAFPGEFERK